MRTVPSAQHGLEAVVQTVAAHIPPSCDTAQPPPHTQLTMGSVLMSERSVIGLSDLQSLLRINDNYYESLTDLFEKLQLATYEASDMMLDFMTFVNSVRYFAVVTRDSYKTFMYRESSTEPARASNPPTHDCGTKECTASILYSTRILR